MREGASMDELFLEKVHKAIENNLANENFGVEELAQEVGISRNHLHRKLKALTGQSASQILKEFRLKKAMELLQNNVATSSEISYQVGFGSPSYFNTCFRQYFGYPPGKVKNHDTLKAKKIHAIPWKYLFASMVVFGILAWIAFYAISNSGKSKDRKFPDKSIAVLPFFNDSPDEENMFFINGIMDQILDNLCKVEDLRVLPRISVEQYRDNPKPPLEIARELNVRYLLIGSGHRYEDSVRVIIQLHDGRKDRELWSITFVRNIHEIFAMGSDIAQKVADDIEAIITPEEKELIEKIPTTNLTALYFYTRGREEIVKYYASWTDREVLDNAEDFFNRALEYDPGYADVYAGLATVYMYKNVLDVYWTNEFLDTSLILANKALSLDHQLAEAYIVRGKCFLRKNLMNEAVEEFDKAIELNPNNWEAFNGKGDVYCMDDFVKTIDNYRWATILNRGNLLPMLLRKYSDAYAMAGFLGKAEYYAEEALPLDGDSALYYFALSKVFRLTGIGESDKNLKLITETLEREYLKDTSNVFVLGSLGLNYLYLHHYEESLKYGQKYINHLKETGGSEITDIAELGYVYLQNGFKEEAETYFQQQIDYCHWMNDLGRFYTPYTSYDLATVYAAMGEKDKAYQNLKVFNERDRMPAWAASQLKCLPLFDCLRGEPEFEQIVREVEAKFRAEHERTRRWLEENDML